MRNIIASAAIATGLFAAAPQAHAEDAPPLPPQNTTQFNQWFNHLYDAAIKYKYRPQRACYPGYCSDYMGYESKAGGWVSLYYIYDTSKDNKPDLWEFCLSDKGEIDRHRRCYWSDGYAAEQNHNGKLWMNGKVIAETYPNPEGDATPKADNALEPATKL
jgi:hypothetical protein